MEEVVSVSLPKNDVCFEFLKYPHKAQIKILELGTKVYVLSQDIKAGWDNKQIDELLKREKSLREKIIHNHKKEKELLSEDIRTSICVRYTNDIEVLHQKNKLLEEKLNMLVEQRLDDHKRISTELTSKFEKKEEKIRKEYEERLQKEQLKYESTFVHTQNSTILGQDGENLTEFKLNRMFPTAHVENCAKIHGRGDFIMTEKDFVMMIETKNYTKNVLKTEIDKFYRDVDNNGDIKCAIMVSLKSGICAREDFQFEVRNGKPILFLHNLSSCMDNLDMAVRFFKLILNTNKIDLASKEVLEKVKNMVPAIKRNWRKMKKSLETLQTKMSNCIIEQEQFISDLFQLIMIKY